MDRSGHLAQACRISAQLAILRGIPVGETAPIPESLIADTIRIAVNETLGMMTHAAEKVEGFAWSSEADRKMLLDAIARKFGITGRECV